MSRFIDEADRSQGVLLPETIDEYVAEEKPVRVIEAFVAALDLGSLGFAGVEPKATVAIDGSKFKAVNHRDRNFTAGKMKTRMALIEQSIAEYLEQLDRMDRRETPRRPRRAKRLRERLATLREEMSRLEGLRARLEATPDGQVSLTDPDARSMASQGKGTGIVGYNVQTAVETKHHLIVAHEVTNVGSDRHQLKRMAEQARAALGATDLTAFADRGYYAGEEIKACTEAGIVPLVPKILTSGNRAAGRFDESDFVYDAKRDAFRCPAGEYAIRRFATVENGMTIITYWSSGCPRCVLRDRCTTGSYRRISRWEHEAVLDDMQRRLDRRPKAMQLRRSTVEHPFGTIKARMGATHFLCRRLPRVGAEMSLHVLAYNRKRVMKIMGTGPMIQALRARSRFASSRAGATATAQELTQPRQNRVITQPRPIADISQPWPSVGVFLASICSRCWLRPGSRR